MKIILSILMLLVALPAWSADQWSKSVPASSDNVSAYPAAVQINNNTLDRLLSYYREGMLISYSSATAVSISAGEVACSNSDGSVRKFRQMTTSTSVGWSDIDTGSEAPSTTYYIYATCDTDIVGVVYKISVNSVAPSGITSYKRLGSFYNDASSNISRIINDNTKQFKEKETKTAGATYQALTDGLVGIMAYCADGDKGLITLYSDSASSPATAVGYANCSDRTVGNINGQNSSYTPVKAGDYYSTTTQNILANPTYTVYFVPQN